jgi:hypothetical protein
VRSKLVWAAIVAAAMLALKPVQAEGSAACGKPACARPGIPVARTGQGPTDAGSRGASAGWLR